MPITGHCFVQRCCTTIILAFGKTCYFVNLYINLRRSRDCLCVSVAASRSVLVCLCHRAASFTYFGEVLRCPHKRIVTVTKVYIARNNIHGELIRFHKKIAILLTLETLKWELVSRLPCLLLCWWRRTFRDMTTSVHYVQAVRTESRSKRQFGSN